MAIATNRSANKKSAKKSPAKKTAAKKSAANKSPAKKPSSAQHCWPGFEPVPGKSAGEKGSCKPMKKQSEGEKEGDRKAAAATKGAKK
jgi:hypothetical protein